MTDVIKYIFSVILHKQKMFVNLFRTHKTRLFGNRENGDRLVIGKELISSVFSLGNPDSEVRVSRDRSIHCMCQNLAVHRFLHRDLDADHI